MRCPNCGLENLPDDKFCVECGRSLAVSCPSCGAALPSHAKFCGQCGSTLAPPVEAAAALAALRAFQSQEAAGQPTTELRHVTVLFCDLVGFTPFSEKRDAEEVREVLSGYFDLARAIVGRYGGVVQKFIGDAVMAVWGAPVAKEDDAERAVRAALELTSAVAAYGSEHGTELQARVGVASGEAATTETAEEGLVIGDRVNTAARIQAAAPPGHCYVDEATRAATSAAIAYVDAGEHALKGKSEPVHLFNATRVVAAVAGSQRSGVIEAPFIGRDRELHLVKELFHGTAERHLARMVLVSGVAGVGKSRLAWEFFKYIDGLAGDVLWHAGRCLSYGEGVSYWALSEMVRARLQISEEDPQEVVAERLRTGLERWIGDPADREFISPRLGQLLGLPAPQVLAREELFAGWRLFFERLAEYLPVVMVVEDLQWADAGLVEFLDHLLEWSGDHALYLLVLSRPEGTERRGLGLSRRSVTTLALDPLSDEVIGQLLDGLVSGLPDAARARIVERAEGIPLYAIETVRGLLDKGVLDKGEDGALHLVGELGTLEIPPGLTALIASRLDALSPDERRLVKECSVLGGSFPRQAIEALSDMEASLVDELLSSLVRKEVLTVRADKLSPERGQYAFTQSLIRSVAYDTLTRTERKARHLRTAEHLQAAFPDEGAEVAEVIGAHLYDAYVAAADDPDADDLRARACKAYSIAGERAESVGAPDAAETAYLRAAELSCDGAEQASLTAGAGRMAHEGGWYERAISHFEEAIAGSIAAGKTVEAARITAWLGTSLELAGRGEQAITRLRQALGSLEGAPDPSDVLAELKSRLGAALLLSGHAEEAVPVIEESLTLAQHHELPEQLARSLNVRGMYLVVSGRAEEARLNYEGYLAVSRRYGNTRGEAGAENNLADLCMIHDLPGAEEHAEAAVTLARRRGDRGAEDGAAGNLMYILMMAGRLDEAFRLGTELLQGGGDERAGAEETNFRLACLQLVRGRTEEAREHLAVCRAWAGSDDVQHRAMHGAAEAAICLAAGDGRAALESADGALSRLQADGWPVAHEAVRFAFPIAVEAAIDLGDLDEADRLIKMLSTRPRGEVPPFLRAQITRSKALVTSARGENETVEEHLTAVEEAFAELGYPYWTARAQLDRAEWLARQGRVEESTVLAAKAAAAFEAIGAAPMLLRASLLAQPDLSRSGQDGP
ncbi:MAG: adenylate/guanylate cyclase domain-containing protein [Acidimicrobiales bacterium]